MFFNKKDNDSKQRFGIRKLTVGACSVLLSTLILGVEMQEPTSKVQAATTDTSNNYSTTEPAKNSKNTYLTSSEVKETTTEATSVSKKEKSAVDNAGQNLSKENDDKTVIPSASVTENNKLNTVSNKTESNTEEDSAKTEALNNNEENKNTGDSNKENTVENTANANTVAEDTASLDLNKVKDNGRINNLKDTVEISLLKSATVSKLRTLSSSNDIAGADEIKASAAVTIPSNDGRYTLYISRNTWGNTTDGNQPAKVLLSGNVLTGDTVTISIPSYGIVGVTQPTIDANYGSASIKDVGNEKVVTYNFTTSGVINPIITIPADNGYGAKPQPMQITQPTVKDITWTINGVEQTSAKFHIDINPVWNPKFALSKPNPESTDQNALKKMIPNYESIYQLAINETNGVAPGQDYSNTPLPSQKINSAVNYGTIITIPMPKGYVLDQSATMQLNNFGDKTTITQEGNNVIITVPKGSGTQNWNSGPAYQLVGSYDIAMPAIATTYTADAPITIVQKLNDDGSQTKVWNGPIVSQDFYGTNDEIPLGQMPLYAQAAYYGNQLLNNGHKHIVAYFGITNESIASYNDYSSKLAFNFDEGLGVTELKTPTIPGTSNYKYTITYADGTTSEGQVNAGETITGTGVITNIVVSPDDLERDQSTAINLPLNNFANQTTQSVNAFEAYGAVPDTVKPGTQLVANMTFTGTIQQGNVTRYLTNKVQFGQNVVSPKDLTSSIGIWSNQTSTATGKSNVAGMSLAYGGGQTNNIYEPIFYYVLPEWFSVYDFSTDYTKLPQFWPNSNNGVVGVPKLSLFTVPTNIPGLSRQVVKIDYSGTGYNYLSGGGANNYIHFNTLPDGANGTYQGMIYIVSPTTKLTNAAYNPNNTSNFAPSGITFNPDWVQGNTSNLYYVGSAGFTINQVGGANTASVAQGNQDDILVDSGISNLYDSNEMEYAVRLINSSGANLTNVVALVNLPQASDTSFTFQLSGRPVYDGDKTNYTFLYSTELGDLKSNSDPDGTKPDETGYVTADQVTNWSKIKSIIIKTSSLNNNGSSDRLIFTGIDPNLVNDAGKTGYISTGFYSDTTKPFISSEAIYNASTDPNKVKPANITVTGEAKINFKLRYTDENGQVQTVDLPELSTGYNLAQNNTMLTEQEAINLANRNAASSIPANYEIKSATLQSGGKTWQTDAPAGTPVFGGNVQYFYNNATVILEAVPIQRTLTYKVIDENDPSNPVIIQSNTDLLSNGQAITGNQGSNVPTDATTAYNAVKSALEKQGYVISSNSSTVPETFGPDNTALTIYVTHKRVKVSTPDQWPSSSTDTDKVALSKTLTRTIKVEGLPTPVEGTTQSVTFNRTAIVDEVTGKVIGYVDPSDSTKTITDGDAAWTSTNATWSSWTSSTVPEGYYIESAKVGNTDYPAVTTNANGIITGLNSITVTPEMSSITVNVVYNKVNLDLTINHDTITNTYNGSEQPVSTDIISEITHTVVSSNTDVSVQNIAQAIQDANLTSDDYSYTDDQGNILAGAPTNAGNYRIILNQNGLDKLKQVAGGLTINYDPSKSYVNYTIEKAQATAELKGNNSKTYDAKAVSNVEVTKDGNIKITANVPGTTQGAYQLQAGDYDWYSEDGSTKLNGAPTNVGNYTIKLNSTGIANIKAHYGNSNNVNWTDDAITGSATYEITKAAATISLTEENKQTSTWTGDVIPVNPADFVPTIITDNGQTLTVPVGTLGVGDYTVTPSPVVPDTYKVSLTPEGIEKIKRAIPTSGNYVWSKAGNGLLEIVKAKADYQMSGSGETTYTGSPVELPMNQLKAAISSSNTVSGQNLVIPNFDANDFTWSSGNAPTNAGEYTIKLSETGINKITTANPNYGLTLGTNVFTYTIKAADATAKLTGNNRKIYNGQATTTAEVNSNGQIKVALDYLGKTENYTLQTGDYTWSTSDGNAPTDVGTYTIKLTSVGLTNLQKVINDKNGVGNVNLITAANNAGTANFEIIKAIPSASFTGQDQKTYDGTPIAGYVPTLTITAPGPHDVALVAGTDYVWTKDGQTFTTAPTDAGEYTVSLTSKGIGKIKAANAANLDWSNVTINENASYTINKAQATVNFDNPASQTVEYGKNTFDANNFKPIISTNNQVTVNIPEGVTLSADAGDFEFTAANGDKTTTVPTELGTYTVTLSENGFKKLQSQTNNYNWINAASGTYTVNKATNISVILDGHQEVTYTGNTFTNSDINVDDYQVVLGNGQTYKLVAGDLEFVSSQNPTNVGSYKVQLSTQGKENIAKVGATHYSYNFDNTGTRNFEIQKAIPSVKFNASAEKVFDGTPIALDNYATKPAVTVTAPGNPTVILEDGDYVWVKDGITYTTAPSNVGVYTIELSESGKNKILQNSNNSENLDWSNAKISGEGSYVITETTASANLSGSASKTYDGKPVTTTEINAKDGTVEVTISISNSNETVTYKLQAGDYTWNTPNEDAPTDAGSYTLSLSKTGLANFQGTIDNKWGEGNVKITDSDLKGEATFTITKDNITISGNHTQTRTYIGNPQVVDPGNFPITLIPDGDGPVPTIPDGTLTSDDFVVKDKDGNPVDPTNVGDYTVYLTPEGVEKLKELNPNYNWPTTEQEVGKLVIETAQANAIVSGENSRIYNGQVISTVDLYNGGDIDVTISGINGAKITYTLREGDYDWSVTDPTNVGTYTLTLNSTGISHLQEVLTEKYGAGNVTLENTAVTGNARFTITPAPIIISGNGSQIGTYTGNPQVVDPGNFPITLIPDGDGPVPTIPDGTLTSDDFVVKDKDGNPVDPTNVGDYTVYLTSEGVEKLKELNPNYDWPTTEQEVGTLTVTPAKMDVTLSGNGSKVSDGQPASVDLSTLLDNLTGNNLNKDGLTLDNFSWNTPDGNAPTEVGNYTITLSENGLKKLQDNNSNYTVNVTGEFKYSITPASQKIEYVDGNGKIIKAIDNIGTDSSNYGDKVDFDVKQNVPKDYKLVDSNVPTQITIENGVTKFVIEPNIVTTTETKTITRTIIVE
ncbi:MBG domain-containing protein, partial [Lactobacillus taiwanensis]|uniref:MBG domain-containing protein n=1 Tax=Lactobacillus taiwanensis TaxID=508451 RepID=UPI0012EE2459